MIEMICLIYMYHNIFMNIHGKIICLVTKFYTHVLIDIHDRNELSYLSQYTYEYSC